VPAPPATLLVAEKAAQNFVLPRISAGAARNVAGGGESSTKFCAAAH